MSGVSLVNSLYLSKLSSLNESCSFTSQETHEKSLRMIISVNNQYWPLIDLHCLFHYIISANIRHWDIIHSFYLNLCNILRFSTDFVSFFILTFSCPTMPQLFAAYLNPLLSYMVQERNKLHLLYSIVICHEFQFVEKRKFRVTSIWKSKVHVYGWNFSLPYQNEFHIYALLSSNQNTGLRGKVKSSSTYYFWKLLVSSMLFFLDTVFWLVILSSTTTSMRKF